jgi:PAS domain S-box-containing protein
MSGGDSKSRKQSRDDANENVAAIADRFRVPQHLIDKIPDTVVIVDADGIFRYVNKACVSLWGYEPSEMVGRPFIDFVEPSDRDRTLKIANEIVNGLVVTNFENYYVRKDGSIIPVIWSVSWDAADQVMYGVARNARDIKDTESLLAVSESLLNESQRLAKMGSWNFDFRTDKLTWSDALYDVFDVDRDTFKETHGSFLDLIDDEDREMAYETSRRSQATGEPFNIRYRITTPKGEKKVVEEFGYSEKGPSGNILRLFGTAQDVTERVAAENEVLKSRERYKTVFDFNPLPMWIYDLKTFAFLDVNQMAVETYGYTKDEFLSMTIMDIRPKDDIPMMITLHKDLSHLSKSHFGVYTHLKKNGAAIRMSVTGHRMDYLGQDCMIVVCIDVTEKEKLQLLYDRASQMARIGSWEINYASGSSYYSPIVREIHEMPDDYEISLERGVEFYHDDDARDQIVAAVRRARIVGTPWDLELPIVTAKGNNRWIRSIGEAEFRDGTCYRLYGSFQDVTGAKKTELELKRLNDDLKSHAKELELSNADLERFAYVVSHDLQEPLRMIASFMSLLEKKYNNKLDEKAHQYIHFAVDGAKRMRKIILDLLEFSRMGGNDGEREPIDLNELIAEFKLLRRKLISEKKAVIHCSTLPHVTAHRAPVTLVFHGLLDNALKYSRDNVAPEIWVDFVDKPDTWEFSVKDNGIGIEAEYFDKIFVIFQRLRQHDKVAGSGMGLAIAKRIVESYKGKIWLESEPSKGSTFYFTIPKQPGTETSGSIN